MPTLNGLKNQLYALVEDQEALVHDARPWSQKRAEFDRREADVKALVEQVKALQAVDSHPFATGATDTPGAKSWAADVAARVTKSVNDYGVKAITTGGIDVPSIVDPTVPIPSLPARLLDLIPAKKVEGNEYEYLRQTVRTNNASTVADGGTKPTSVYTFEDESDRVRVLAHLSEPLPLRILSDHAEVEALLRTQMAEDLYLALEDQVMNGDGTGENLTGLATTTIQTQAYTTSVLTTLRKAHTKLVKSAENPTAWVLNPDDLEAIDLTLDGNDNFMGGIDAKIFQDLPRVSSTRVTAGTAYLGDWSLSRLYVREGGRLDADTSGDLFDKNQAKLRYEGRFGFAVLRPNAFIEIDLTA